MMVHHFLSMEIILFHTTSRIEIQKSDKRKSTKKTKYKSDYVPKEADIYYPTSGMKKEQVSPERGEKVNSTSTRKSTRSNKGIPPERMVMSTSTKSQDRSKAKNPTSWVAWNMGQIMKLAATMAMGILLLPTHVVAQPTVDFPEITT